MQNIDFYFVYLHTFAMDTPATDSEKVPSFFDERPADPEAPYKIDKPHKSYNRVKGFFYVIGTICAIFCMALLYSMFIKPLLPLPDAPMQTLQPNTPTAISHSSSWKTYSMSNNWKFSYPKEWHVLVDRKGQEPLVGISDKTSSTNQHVGTVFLEVAEQTADTSFDALLTKDVGTIEKGLSTIRTILAKPTIDGYPAVTYALENTRLSGSYTHSIVTVIDGPAPINISTLSVKNNEKTYDGFIKIYFPVHQQIAASFTFSK